MARRASFGPWGAEDLASTSGVSPDASRLSLVLAASELPVASAAAPDPSPRAEDLSPASATGESKQQLTTASNAPARLHPGTSPAQSGPGRGQPSLQRSIMTSVEPHESASFATTAPRHPHHHHHHHHHVCNSPFCIAHSAAYRARQQEHSVRHLLRARRRPRRPRRPVLPPAAPQQPRKRVPKKQPPKPLQQRRQQQQWQRQGSIGGTRKAVGSRDVRTKGDGTRTRKRGERQYAKARTTRVDHHKRPGPPSRPRKARSVARRTLPTHRPRPPAPQPKSQRPTAPPPVPAELGAAAAAVTATANPHDPLNNLLDLPQQHGQPTPPLAQRVLLHAGTASARVGAPGSSGSAAAPALGAGLPSSRPAFAPPRPPPSSTSTSMEVSTSGAPDDFASQLSTFTGATGSFSARTTPSARQLPGTGALPRPAAPPLPPSLGRQIVSHFDAVARLVPPVFPANQQAAASSSFLHEHEQQHEQQHPVSGVSLPPRRDVAGGSHDAHRLAAGHASSSQPTPLPLHPLRAALTHNAGLGAAAPAATQYMRPLPPGSLDKQQWRRLVHELREMGVDQPSPATPRDAEPVGRATGTPPSPGACPGPGQEEGKAAGHSHHPDDPTATARVTMAPDAGSESLVGAAEAPVSFQDLSRTLNDMQSAIEGLDMMSRAHSGVWDDEPQPARGAVSTHAAVTQPPRRTASAAPSGAPIATRAVAPARAVEGNPALAQLPSVALGRSFASSFASAASVGVQGNDDTGFPLLPHSSFQHAGAEYDAPADPPVAVAAAMAAAIKKEEEEEEGDATASDSDDDVSLTESLSRLNAIVYQQELDALSGRKVADSTSSPQLREPIAITQLVYGSPPEGQDPSPVTEVRVPATRRSHEPQARTYALKPGSWGEAETSVRSTVADEELGDLEDTIQRQHKLLVELGLAKAWDAVVSAPAE